MAVMSTKKREERFFCVNVPKMTLARNSDLHSLPPYARMGKNCVSAWFFKNEIVQKGVNGQKDVE